MTCMPGTAVGSATGLLRSRRTRSRRTSSRRTSLNRHGYRRILRAVRSGERADAGPLEATMFRKASVTLALLMLAGCARTAKNVVDDVGNTIGAGNLKSIQYSGSGYIYAIGQSFQPDDRYSKFNLKSYTRLVDYDKSASREEDLPAQFANPPRGGGVQ